MNKIRQIFRRPISWVLCALVSGASFLLARYNFQSQSRWDVFLQWHRGPPLVALVLVGLICEILFSNGRMRRTRALILVPVAIFQLKDAVFFLYTPDWTWLPGIASAVLILVAAAVALEPQGSKRLV